MTDEQQRRKDRSDIIKQQNLAYGQGKTLSSAEAWQRVLKQRQEK